MLFYRMFPYIPEEIENHIFKFYYSINVLEQVKNRDSIWKNPSEKLISICNELGNFQPRYSDLEKCLKNDIEEDLKNAVLKCIEGKCSNCLHYRFPCLNAKYYGGLHELLSFEYNY